VAAVLGERWEKMHVSALNISRPSTGDRLLRATLILPADHVTAHRDAEVRRRQFPKIGPGDGRGRCRSPYHLKLKHIRQCSSRNLQFSGTEALSCKLAQLKHKNGRRRVSGSRCNVEFRQVPFDEASDSSLHLKGHLRRVWMRPGACSPNKSNARLTAETYCSAVSPAPC
jgi:hypothetical protein